MKALCFFFSPMLQTSSEHSAPSSLCQQGRKATALSPQEPATGCFSWQEWRVLGAQKALRTNLWLIVDRLAKCDFRNFKMGGDSRCQKHAICTLFVFYLLCFASPGGGLHLIIKKYSVASLRSHNKHLFCMKYKYSTCPRE